MYYFQSRKTLITTEIVPEESFIKDNLLPKPIH